jgi:hypothetical protein
MMEAALDAGRLVVPRLDGAFSVIAGQARWGNVVARGDAGGLTITGTVDLAEWTLDARLTLAGPAGDQSSAAAHPDVFVGLKGPLAAPKRALDVSALTGWLTLRTVERQSKEIEALEAKRQEAERREAERREAERREAERREAERREAARREAERREAEQRERELQGERPESSVGSTAPGSAAPAPSEPGAQPAPAAIRVPPAEESPEQRSAKPAAPRRAAVPTEPADAAPALPPPLEIRPAPEPRNSQGSPKPPQGAAPNDAQKQRPTGAGRPPADVPPAAGRRSVLDYLFGPQR